MIDRDNLQLQSTIEDSLQLHIPRAPSSVLAIFRQSEMVYVSDIGKICNRRPEMMRSLKEQISVQTITTLAIAVSEFIDAAIDAYKVKVLKIGTGKSSVGTIASQGTKSSPSNDLMSWLMSKSLDPHEYTSLPQAGISTLSSLLVLDESQLRSLSIKKVPLLKLKKAIDEENGTVKPSIPPTTSSIAPSIPPLSRGLSGEANTDDSSDPLTLAEASASINMLRLQRELENSFLTRINSIVLEEHQRFMSKALEVLMSSKADHQDRAKRLASLITDKIARDDTSGNDAFRADIHLSRRRVRFTSTTRMIESPLAQIGYTSGTVTTRAPSRDRGRPLSGEAVASSSSSSCDLGLAHLRLKESQRLVKAEESKRNLEAFQLSNGGWKCSTCTMINDCNRTRCSTCNTNKPYPTRSSGGSLEVNHMSRPSSSSGAAATTGVSRLASSFAAGGSMAGILGGSSSGWDNKDHSYKPPPAISPHYSAPIASSHEGRRDVARPPPAIQPALLYDKVSESSNNLKMWTCYCGSVNRISAIQCKACHRKRC